MVEMHIINDAARRLREAAPPGSQVILFGSHARGDAGPRSDLDFLVVEPEVEDELSEMVRLRRAMRPLPIYADVLVIDRDDYNKWADTPNNVYYEAAREGKVLADPRNG